MSNIIINKYKDAGLIPFSFKLDVKSTGKKDLSNIPLFKTINKFNKKYIDMRQSGHAIRTGTPYGDKFIIGVDIDNKPQDAEQLDGLQKWKELLNKHYDIIQDKNIYLNDTFNIDHISTKAELLFLETPTQKTGNDGYHYLFLIDAEQLKIIKGGLNGLFIDNSFKKYSIDIKAEGGYLIAEPAKYSTKYYKWLKAPSDTKILNIPEWLYNIIQTNKQPKKPRPKEDIEEPEQKKIIIKKAPASTTTKKDIIYKYIECLNKKRYNNYNEWKAILLIFKNNNLSYDIFLEKTKNSSLYEQEEWVLQKWNSFNHKNGYELKALYSMAKNDNPLLFNKIYSEGKHADNINNLFDVSQYKFIDINKKYIIDGTETDNIINNSISRWLSDEKIKSLNIKSHYGSGKTQLIKNILDKYQPPRVLWVSYRQTLTDNIEDEFQHYNFKSYLNKDYDGDRQIIQLESIDIIKEHYQNTHDSGELPEYDIIIIDEIESILNHFNSTTFKHNKSKEIFISLFNIIQASKKVLSLDGDLNARALSYISNFGEMININNLYNDNERHFNFMQDEPEYLKQLLDDITTAKKENKKVAICSMSKNCTIKYTQLINEHFKYDIDILTINSETDDADKKKLKNIKTEILKYDVFIYSPTVEAGVNIDIEGLFNKLYCIICGGSTSPRAFLQMTARIRHLNNNNINILNTSLIKNDIVNFWEYADAKENLKQNAELILERTLERNDNNKLIECYKLSPYMQTIIYNRVESLNNNPAYFIALLCILCTRKGIKFTFGDEKKHKIKFDNEAYLINLIECKDIKNNEKSIIKARINNRTASTEDKIRNQKLNMLKLLAVDKLDIDILEDFLHHAGEIRNFINLIDDSQIKISTSPNYIQVEIIKKLIKQLGYNNIYDEREIKEDEFNNNLMNIINTKTEKYNCFDMTARASFNLCKFNTNTILLETIDTRTQQPFFGPLNEKLDTIQAINSKTRRPFLGHINTLLKRYCLKITLYQRREANSTGENKTNFYMLEHLKKIDEIIYYKKMNNVNIKDIDNKINFETYHFKYAHLRTSGQSKDEFTDDDEDGDLINNIEMLNNDICQ